MRILNILSLFLAGTAFSSLLLLLLIPVREIGPRFHRLFGILSGSFLLTEGVFHYPELPWSWGLALASVAAYTLGISFKPRELGIPLYPIAVVGTLFYFTLRVGGTFSALGAGPLEFPLYFLNLISSSLFLGITLMAMMLGHWYLVDPKLSIDPFKKLVAASIAIMAARCLAIAGGLAHLAWSLPPEKGEALKNLFSVEGELVFLIQRVLFGLILPALLSYFIWHTVKLRATQSATGILYVNLVFVLIGELLGIHITLTTHFLM